MATALLSSELQATGGLPGPASRDEQPLRARLPFCLSRFLVSQALLPESPGCGDEIVFFAAPPLHGVHNLEPAVSNRRTKT